MEEAGLEAAGDEGLWRIAFEKLRKKLDAIGASARIHTVRGKGYRWGGDTP